MATNSSPSFFARFNALVDNGWLDILTPIQKDVYLIMLRLMNADGKAWPGGLAAARSWMRPGGSSA